MVLVTFVFEFDRADKRYKAGDTVFCKLHVTVHERFKARSLSLRFAGKAYTQWSKTGLGRYTVYKGKEEYFREYQFFFGSLNGPAEDVKPGKYQYESSFVLPKSLPSSIAHPYGCIRYTASARYEVAWDFNFKGAEEFYVKTIVDLADQPELKNCVKQVSKKGYKYFSGCCDAGFVNLTTILPRGGYLLNQPIFIDVIVDNKSKLNIKLIKVKLRERITFHSKEPKPSIKETTKTIAKYSFDTVIPQFQDKLFQIQFDHNPLQEWKLLQGCGIITCEYFIESQAFVNSCRLPTVNVTKLTFGTISSDENGSATTLTAKSIKDGGDITEEHPVPAIFPDPPVLIREPPKSRELSPIPSIGSNINWSSDLGEIPDVDVEMAHLSFLDDPPTALFPDHPNS